VLSEAGIILSDIDENAEEDEDDRDEDDEDDEDNPTPAPRAAEPREPSGQVSLDELTKMLAQALEKEDYEKAAKIRDELNKRNG
jgi:excinuclease UvrABC helicase subunit UvrB